MKASELMIGDWVRMRLSFGTQWYIDKVGVINPENEIEYEPIPLTEEILKANGFKQEPDGAYTWYDNVHIPEQVYVAVSLRRDGSARIIDVHNHRKQFFTDSIPYGYSVHELQHALRLCGLNELAEKFKIN